MSNFTLAIGQQALNKVIRYENLVNLSVGKGAHLKFDSIRTDAYVKTKKATQPETAFYKVVDGGRVTKISLFELNSFTHNGVELSESIGDLEGDLQVAEELHINKVSHQRADGSFTDSLEEETNLEQPKFRYPLHCYAGFQLYLAERSSQLSKLKESEKADFRMDQKYSKACRATALLEEKKGKHYRRFSCDSPILEKTPE